VGGLKSPPTIACEVSPGELLRHAAVHFDFPVNQRDRRGVRGAEDRERSGGARSLAQQRAVGSACATFAVTWLLVSTGLLVMTTTDALIGIAARCPEARSASAHPWW
jgi:hypothetical protein